MARQVKPCVTRLFNYQVGYNIMIVFLLMIHFFKSISLIWDETCLTKKSARFDVTYFRVQLYWWRIEWKHQYCRAVWRTRWTGYTTLWLLAGYGLPGCFGCKNQTVLQHLTCYGNPKTSVEAQQLVDNEISTIQIVVKPFNSWPRWKELVWLIARNMIQNLPWYLTSLLQNILLEQMTMISLSEASGETLFLSESWKKALKKIKQVSKKRDDCDSK